MDFTFDEDQELLRSTIRRFLEDRHPLAALRPVLEAPEVFDDAHWRAGAELGWTTMLVSEEDGGGSVTSQPLVDLVGIAEELGRVLHPGPLLGTNVVADAVGRFGSDAQRRDLLPRIASGELTAAWAFTGDGSADVTAVAVTATADDTNLRLDGHASYVHAAASAQLLLVSANTADGIIHIAVPADTAGVGVRTLDGLDLTRRLGHVTFEGALVTTDAVVGTSQDGNAVIERALAVATVIQAAEATGAAGQLLEMTVQYAQDRVQFGRPIGSFQAIKHRLADLFIDVQAMEAATHAAALAVADDAPDWREAVATAGSFVRDAFHHLCGEALQLHGGIGFTWEHDVHLFVRRAKVDQVLYGEPAWHRERLCALMEVAV